MQCEETYSFNSTKPAHFILDWLTAIIEKIKFMKSNNIFQHKVCKDIQKIKRDNHFLISAEKTNKYSKLKNE